PIDVRLIVITETLFFLNGLALIVEVLLGYGERAHAIALQPKRERQLTGRQRLVIIGALAGSGSVHGAAGVRNILKVRGLRHIFRTLKHHVLEQMSETRTAFALVARTHIVID